MANNKVVIEIDLSDEIVKTENEILNLQRDEIETLTLDKLKTKK